MRLLALGACLAIACGAEPGSLPDAAMPDASVRPPDLSAIVPSVSATVRAHPDNVVSVLVDVQSANAARVSVEFGDDASYGRETPRLPLPPNGALTVPVFGLTPNATSHLRVTVFSDDGRVASTPDLGWSAGPLPVTMPAFQVTLNRGGVQGVIAMGLESFPAGDARGAIVDRDGRLLWYREVPPPTTAGLEIQPAPNGRYFLYESATLSFAELTLAGDVVHRWASPSYYGTDGHDLIALGNQHVLLLGQDPHPKDTRPYFDGGAADGLTVDTSIDEVDLDGGVSFHWTSWPAVDLTEALGPDPYGPQDPTAPVVEHPNALSLAADGNLLASFRVPSVVVKIDRKTGAILWRLGGLRSDFTFVGDPLGRFYHQHDARYLPNGHLMLLDNGDQHVPPVSRVCEYQLDESARTATLVWSYTHDPPIFSYAAGSARRLPDGGTLVSWAVRGLVTEIDASSAPRWELHVAGKVVVVYRALRVDSLYP